jgi:DUF4097 and DUF4098 domain-containing protein YvlB
MKTTILALHIVIFALAIQQPGIAQKEEEQIKLSFSKPDEPGFLNIEAFQGNINITGYNGKEVIVELPPCQGDVHNPETPRPEAPSSAATGNEEVNTEGLNKIKSSSFDISVTEEENKITIKSGPPMNCRNLNISVPYNCSFKISTVNGNISVKEVKGELDITTVNGEIDLDKITGSAVTSTINGLLKVRFSDVTPDAPMAFSTINGHIDVTLPPNIKATLKMKTDAGEIYSDFDLETKEELEKSDKSNKYSPATTSWSNWTTANINGGGPELVFKSLHGNIHIRKGK